MHARCALPHSMLSAMAVAGVFVAGVAGAMAQEPLRIAKQGSIEVGGEMVFCPTNDGGDPKSQRWPPGRVMINDESWRENTSNCWVSGSIPVRVTVGVTD